MLVIDASDKGKVIVEMDTRCHFCLQHVDQEERCPFICTATDPLSLLSEEERTRILEIYSKKGVEFKLSSDHAMCHIKCM
jgi:hypothetical protein